MGFFKDLFSGGGSADDAAPDAGLQVHMQDDDARQIRISADSITHAFVALTADDVRHSDSASENMAQLGRATQPDVWNREFRAKFCTFAVSPLHSGDPDPLLVFKALQQLGMTDSSAVAIDLLTVSFDGGSTESKIGVGFAYKSNQPSICLARSGGFAAQ